MADTTSTFKNLPGLQHVGSFVRCTTMDAGRDLLLVATDTDIHMYTQHMKLKGSHHLAHTKLGPGTTRRYHVQEENSQTSDKKQR